jgi:hypothetical protein
VRDGAGNQVTARGPVLARRAAAVLAPRVVPALLAAFDAGEPVSFGPVRIDRQGITAPEGTGDSAARLMAWTDMRRITIAGHIIERGAAGADVQVGYRQEKRLPPRDIAGLTAG